MDLNNYQQAAVRTAVYGSNCDIMYPALGLCSEAGEVCGIIKRIYRDDLEPEEVMDDLKAELGDCLWYIAALAHDLGLTLTEIAAHNLTKLQSRQQRGKLTGSGDYR
jgi:NTP pyrophosphatase (non-canonical NTP hydrolase)